MKEKLRRTNDRNFNSDFDYVNLFSHPVLDEQLALRRKYGSKS